MVAGKRRKAARFLFLLNHGAAEATISLDPYRGADLLSGQPAAGAIVLPALGVAVVSLAP